MLYYQYKLMRREGVTVTHSKTPQEEEKRMVKQAITRNRCGYKKIEHAEETLAIGNLNFPNSTMKALYINLQILMSVFF